MLDFSKLRKIQENLITVYQQSLRKDEIFLNLPINYARILFNVIISPNNNFKQQFIDEQGIYILKKILKQSVTKESAKWEMEIYFYCLGIIPSLIQTFPQTLKQEFIENGFC